MQTHEQFDEKKLRQLILYVAARSATDPNFGKTKLNKILFYSDFQAVRTLGDPITWATYVHRQFGPCPSGIEVTLKDMREEGDIAIVPESVFSLTQERIVAAISPELNMFDAREIAFVDEVLSHLGGLNNSEVSEMSHKTMAWKLTNMNQQIPYGLALFSSQEPNEEDTAWLESVSASGSVGS